MPLRIVPDECTEQMNDAVFEATGFYRSNEYEIMMHARPNLTREQVTEIFMLFRKHVDRRIPSQISDEEMEYMHSFLAAAFEQKVEG